MTLCTNIPNPDAHDTIFLILKKKKYTANSLKNEIQHEHASMYRSPDKEAMIIAYRSICLILISRDLNQIQLNM